MHPCPHDPEITLGGAYPREMKACVHMHLYKDFIALLASLTRSSMSTFFGRMDKCWCILYGILLIV